MSLDIHESEYKKFSQCCIAVIGLGYVGLPLLTTFAKTRLCVFTNKPINRKVIGFDINQSRVNELNNHQDKTNSVDKK